MADTFWIKQNDTAPAIQATLKDADGNVVDLTGATVRFHMRASDDTTKVDAAASITSPPTGGIVSYGWVAADTDTEGRYRAEFEVTYSDGTIETFPNSEYIIVLIMDDIA